MGSNQSKSAKPRISLILYDYIWINIICLIEIGEFTAYTGNNSFIVLVSDEFICIYLIYEPNNIKK